MIWQVKKQRTQSSIGWMTFQLLRRLLAIPYSNASSSVTVISVAASLKASDDLLTESAIIAGTWLRSSNRGGAAGDAGSWRDSVMGHVPGPPPDHAAASGAEPRAAVPGLLRGGRRMAVGWDGRAAFAELRLSHIRCLFKGFQGCQVLLSRRCGRGDRLLLS
eukprot:80114-Hanusia_phi.AAC.1